jgi:hypothetical protein
MDGAMTRKTTYAFALTLVTGLSYVGAAAACGGDEHEDKKDESVRICGGEEHDDDDKDESVRLCGGEEHDDDDKDES